MQIWPPPGVATDRANMTLCSSFPTMLDKTACPLSGCLSSPRHLGKNTIQSAAVVHGIGRLLNTSECTHGNPPGIGGSVGVGHGTGEAPGTLGPQNGQRMWLVVTGS